MVKRVQVRSKDLEMKLTRLLDDLGMSLDELDAVRSDCGCCYSLDYDSRPELWALVAEIENVRFLLDV